jgi:hypothetical protein
LKVEDDFWLAVTSVRGTMRKSKWKTALVELLDGVQRELGPGISNETRSEIASLRRRLRVPFPTRNRKRFELELVEFLDSKLVLKAATNRYLGKKTIAVVQAAEAALKEAEAVLQKCREKAPGDLPN